MKKVLLAGTALIGAAVLSAPASAELNLDLGGYFRGYAAYADQDSAAGRNEFEFRRDTEIHVSGETTLDNGLTVGFHTEQQLVSNNTNDATTDEVYAYFSGGWGRVNFGQEDGAAYLLQVAAPSADSNVDGLRPYINSLNSFGKLGYDHADFTTVAGGVTVDRITYLTPKFNGFQAGVSYTPNTNGDINVGGMGLNNASFSDAYEVSARWDGEFSGFGISVGGGYSDASFEGNGAFTDDLTTWNTGLNVAFNAFSVGVAYLSTNNGVAVNGDTDTLVVGAAWDNGPYHAGVSYLTKSEDAAGTNEADRTTIGGGYTFGPGMTFRGAVAFGEDQTVGANNDFTQVTLGTDIQF